MALGTAFGWSNLVTIVLAIGLAFLFGYSLTSVPLLRSGLALAAVVPIALAADTVSITIMEAIDNAVVLAVPGAMDTGLGDPLFWWPLLGGFALAFGPAFLVNRANIRRGRGCCPGSRMQTSAVQKFGAIITHFPALSRKWRSGPRSRRAAGVVALAWPRIWEEGCPRPFHRS